MNLIAMMNTRTLPKRKKLYTYLSSCRSPAFGSPWKFDHWQLDDIEKVVLGNYKEIMLLRNRGGSKTRDGTVMAVFFAYHYNRNGDLNRVLWYSGTETQIMAVRGYFLENRLVDRRNCSSTQIRLFNGNIIQLRQMTDKQAISPRADVIFFDEEQCFKEETYGMALGTLVGGDHRMIHMGTTEVDSVLHINYEKLRPLGAVLEHHVDELSWTTEEEELATYAGFPRWYIQSQLYCQWVRPGGIVFEDVSVGRMSIPNGSITFYGCDPNPVSGHALIGVTYIGNTIYVHHEYPAYVNTMEFVRLMHSITFDGEIEFELNAGEEVMKLYDKVNEINHRPNLNVRRVRWNAVNKMKRIRQICGYKIIVNPSCKDVLPQIRGAVWDKDSPDVPKLKKESASHFLDAFLHACFKDVGSDVDVELMDQIKLRMQRPNPFEEYTLNDLLGRR